MANEVGAMIARRRQQLGLSQVELQRRANLSSSSVVSRAESGPGMPTFETMRAVARALGAEGAMLPVYMRAIAEKTDRPEVGFVVTMPACLLAAPIALVEHLEISVNTIAEPPEIGGIFGGSEWPHEQRPRGVKDRRIKCLVSARRYEPDADETHRFVAGVGSFVVGTLVCDFRAEAIDIVLSRSPDPTALAERSPRISSPYGRGEESPRSWSGVGSVAEALLASGQLAPYLTFGGMNDLPGGSDEEGSAILSLEPLTSRLSPRTRRSLAGGSDENPSPHLSIEMQFGMVSVGDFKRSSDLVADLLQQVSTCSNVLSAKSRGDVENRIAEIDSIAQVFETSAPVVNDFLIRGRPQWRLLLTPVWLDMRRRTGSR